MKTWYLYMVRCASGALYTGITINVEDRVAKHNAGVGAKSVLALGRPVTLVYQKEVGSYSDALKEECRIKKLSKKEKEAMVLRGGTEQAAVIDDVTFASK